MKLKLLLSKSLLVVALLGVGSMSAFADEVNLYPSVDTYFDWATDETKATDYSSTTTLKTGLWQELWNGETPGLKATSNNSVANQQIAVFKFDVSDYSGRITAATLKVTGTNPSTNTAARDICLGYFDNTTWTGTTTANTAGMTVRSASALNIHPFGNNGAANSLRQNIAKGATTEVSFSNDAFITYLNTDADGIVSLIVYSVGQQVMVNSSEATTGKPTLVLTYANETLYTATFNEGNSLSPSVTIYSDAGRTTSITNGTLTDKTTYYYRASLAGYKDSEGSFTVNGNNPTINFTMTAKTAISSLTVYYKDGETVVYTDNQSVAGLYVDDNYNVPYRMYVSKDGKLYIADKQDSDPYYGKTTLLEAETVVDISVTEVNLKGGTLVLLEDLDDSDVDGSANRASYGLSYGNKDYTSAVTLTPGVYTFIVKAMNRGRNSSIYVGDTKVCGISDIYASNNNWTDKTFEDVAIPTSGQVTLVKGESAIDYYDIIIAIRTDDYKISASIGKYGYATFCSEYPLDFTNVDNATAWVATNVADGKVTLTQVEGDIYQGKGLILKSNNGGAAEVSIPVVASSTNYYDDNKLVACLAETTVNKANDGTCYVLSVQGTAPDETVVFAPIGNTSATVNAGQCYLWDAGTGARSLSFVFGEETTGISDATRLKSNDESIKNGEVYNLNGQLVATPSNGIYIVDGKKVIIK